MGSNLLALGCIKQNWLGRGLDIIDYKCLGSFAEKTLYSLPSWPTDAQDLEFPLSDSYVKFIKCLGEIKIYDYHAIL